MESHLDPKNMSLGRMDGRIGYSLYTAGVTDKQYDSYYIGRRSWSAARLSRIARAWCDENGLGELAARYDALEGARYAERMIERLERQRKPLLEQLAEIDAKITEFKALLSTEA